jgi:ribosomal protein L11 methyltransferase
MGFGTGHHATTRLCLAALQRLDLTGRSMLDAGTGSGVLAIAARCLGARDAVGIDDDPDAIQSAQENLELNPAVDQVSFAVVDLMTAPLAPVDVITANLTGALLCRAAPVLVAALSSGGALIVSGLLEHERLAVISAMVGADLERESVEDGWLMLLFRRRGAA